MSTKLAFIFITSGYERKHNQNKEMRTENIFGQNKQG